MKRTNKVCNFKKDINIKKLIDMHSCKCIIHLLTCAQKNTKLLGNIGNTTNNLFVWFNIPAELKNIELVMMINNLCLKFIF